MSSNLIAIIISAAVGLCMLISFFVGMKRGVKKSLLNLGISAVMLITAFLVTPVITNALMGIQIQYNGNMTTLGTITSAFLSGQGDFDRYIENSQTVEGFINGVGPAICGVVVFIILCFVFKLIGQIIYAIVKHACFKAESEQINPHKARLSGGLLSAAKTFLFFVCVLLPLTSLTCLVEQNFFPNYVDDAASAAITDSFDSLPTPEQVANNLPKEVKRAIAGYNRSAVGFVGQLFGIHNVTFDYISQMELNGEKISIRQTASSLLETYNYALELYDDYKEDSTDFFKKLDYDKLDSLKKDMFESGMFKGFILNVIYDYSQSYDAVLEGSSLLDDYGDLFEDIKTGLAESDKPIEDLKNDFYKLTDIIKSAGQTGFLDDVVKAVDEGTTQDLVYTIADEYIDTFMVDAVDGVFNVHLVRSSFGTIMDMVKDRLGSGDIEEIIKTSNSNVTNWNQFIYDVKDILTDVADLYDHINQALTDANFTVEDFMEDKYLFLKANPAKVKLAINDVGGILDKVDKLEIMKDSTNQKLIPQILDVLGFEDILDGVVAPAGITVNYSYMCKKLATAVSYLLEFDLYHEVTQQEYKDAICKIADAVYADSLVDHPEGTLSKKEKLESIFNSLYEFPKVKEITVDSFQDSLSSFVDITVLDDANIRAEELGYMTDILIALAKNKITVGTQQVSYLKYLLTEGNDFEGLINSISVDAVDELLLPIFASQMTDTICETIFDTVQGTMRDVTENPSLTIGYSKAKLKDQKVEICKIFKDFLTIYKQDVTDFDNVSYADLGALLDSMKENAYRIEIANTDTDPANDLANIAANVGIFRTTFDAIIDKAEAEYSIDFAQTMNKEHIYEVSFTSVMKLKEHESDVGDFVDSMKEILDGTYDNTDIKNVLDEIADANEETIEEILNTIVENDITIDLGDIDIDINGQDNIEDAIDSYDGLSDEIKELLKQILLENTQAGE